MMKKKMGLMKNLPVEFKGKIEIVCVKFRSFFQQKRLILVTDRLFLLKTESIHKLV